VGLLAVTVVATVTLLAGGWALGREILATPRPSPSLSSLPRTAAASSPASPSSRPASPSAAPSGSGEPTVVLTGAGDIADCATTGARQTSDLLLAQEGWFFSAGDTLESAGGAACLDATWGRVGDRLLVSALGEEDRAHAAASGGPAAGLGTGAPGSGPASSNSATGSPAGGGPSAVPWSSRDVGAWHVVTLDSECAAVGGCGRESPQGQWLLDDLRHSTALCTLAIWHRPRFSSGAHGDDPDVGPLWAILHDAHADLIVNGHDHDYERFAPQDPSGRQQRPNGIREIVVGTGGAPIGQFGRTHANSEFRLTGTWGVVRLTLHPANYEWQFLPTVGDVADSGSTPCQ
jgi:hypothetical protein